MDSTKLHRYSLGIAAATIAAGTRQLDVIPIETNGFLDGAITNEDAILSTSSQDRTGLQYQKSIRTSNSVTAMWYPGKANALMPPSIAKGEQVVIYRYADTDQFYWSAEGQSDHLRATDTISVGVSAKGESNEKPLDGTNAYHLEMSSDKKTITLKTTKANGEAVAYTAQFNMESGFFEVNDDSGNMIQLDSKTHSLAMQSKSGSRVEINDKDITIEAKNKISIKCLVLDVQATTSATVKSALVDINGTTTKLGGSSLSFSFANSSDGGSGSFNWGGQHNYTSTITHNGVNISSTHKHGGVQGGNGNSGQVVG